MSPKWSLRRQEASEHEHQQRLVVVGQQRRAAAAELVHRVAGSAQLRVMQTTDGVFGSASGPTQVPVHTRSGTRRLPPRNHRAGASAATAAATVAS